MGIIINMKIEFDDVKMIKVMRKRGLHLGTMARMVLQDANAKTYEDNRHDYGEQRWRIYGKCLGSVLCVCATERGDAIRVITMFNVGKKEQEKYYD